jgi:hypothetical protein
MKRLKRLWRRSDLYALPITLRYKGEKKFYTNFGAATSCVLILTIFVIFSNSVHTMLSDTRISQSALDKFAS